MRTYGTMAGLALMLAAALPAPAFARQLSDAEIEALRAQRVAASSATYAQADQQVVAKAVMAALRSIDPNDVKVEAVDGKVLGLRRWHVYRIYWAPNGIDYYEVTIAPAPDGTRVTIRFDREARAGLMGLMDNEPHGYHENIQVYGSQGASLDDYALFHARMRYFLNGSMARVQGAQAREERAVVRLPRAVHAGQPASASPRHRPAVNR